MVRLDRLSHSVGWLMHSQTLFDFFGANFHEDWDLEASSWEEIIDAYVRQFSSRKHVLNAVTVEIERLLALPKNDDQLSEILFREYGCYYLPDPLEFSMRSWLQAIHGRLTLGIHS